MTGSSTSAGHIKTVHTMTVVHLTFARSLRWGVLSSDHSLFGTDNRRPSLARAWHQSAVIRLANRTSYGRIS
jgi:hypothetical protein